MQCPTPIRTRYKKYETDQQPTLIDVPCGRCGACKHNRRSEWTFRLKEEQRQSTWTLFSTFTYAEKTLPTTVNQTTGEVVPTLDKDHYKKFLKRCKYHQNEETEIRCRYYGVGEYGTHTGRPHYHLIFFDLHPAVVGKLESIWGRGHICVEPVQKGALHYVSKYHVNANHSPEGQTAEFATMSQGIGKGYIKRAKKWHLENFQSTVRDEGWIKSMPRYYKEKIFTDNQRAGMGHANRNAALRDEKEELERLGKLGYTEPDKELHTRRLKAAAQITNKAHDNDTF